ncbi:hypothetical protein H8356DRAFT_1416255 [Neocallimastix lanati (nom. inval.)]|nr:hypothetical protein H8356DRAFT_1416255 [Neocallimastix sp. JGI-2020a]
MEKNLEIEISKTNRGKEQIILNRKYKFNLSSKRKDNSKKYKCTEYKTLNQCPSFIILNNENQILEYDDSHNHLENKFGAAKSIVKNKIKDEISKSSIPFNVNIKRTYDEISQGMGLICPGYNSIKSQVTRSRRKQLPPDITTFDEIPNESKYYKTKSKYNSIEITPKIFHCDFEKAVSNAAQKCQEHNYVQFLEFLGYFKKTYLINFETENWNYYELQKEESKYYIDDERRTAGILRNKKQKKLIRTEEIKALESVRNDFIELWLKCLNDLNIKIID